ncbi:MAG: hypothetical protein K6G83_10880 [Lachnospiraceae bacterium]|nr:hypothetical protein [Lachnospiraceae bacterium]
MDPDGEETEGTHWRYEEAELTHAEYREYSVDETLADQQCQIDYIAMMTGVDMDM